MGFSPERKVVFSFSWAAAGFLLGTIPNDSLDYCI